MILNIQFSIYIITQLPYNRNVLREQPLLNVQEYMFN